MKFSEQVKCEVIVRKNFTGCERREILSGVYRISLHMVWPEPQRRCDGAKTLHQRWNMWILRTCYYLDRLISPDQFINLKNGAWWDVRKAHSRHMKLNLEAKVKFCKLGFLEGETMTLPETYFPPIVNENDHISYTFLKLFAPPSLPPFRESPQITTLQRRLNILHVDGNMIQTDSTD